MAISIQITPDFGMAIVTCSGVLGLDDARAGVSTLWATAGWNGKSVVWDFRNAQFDLAADDIREVAEYVSREQPAIPPERVAFTTARDVDFGLARMFEVFREDPRTKFQVFRDYDEAVSWAGSVESDIA